MATRTVKSSGGDYTSLSAWEAGRQADLTGLGPEIAECSTALADTTAVVVDGWTTTAADYIEIKAVDGSWASPLWSTSKYRLSLSSGALQVNEHYTRVRGLQIEQSSLSDIAGCVSNGNVSGGLLFDSCHCRAAAGGTHLGVAINVHSNGLNIAASVVVNCLAIGNWGNDGFGGNIFVRAELAIDLVSVYNCTTYGGRRSIRLRAGRADSDVVAKNNLFIGATSTYHDSVGTGVNNAFDASTKGGTDTGAIDLTATADAAIFTDQPSGDYSLVTASAAKDVGVNLSADSAYAFSVDIDAQARVAPWDVGADEIVVLAGFSLAWFRA